MKQYVLEGRVTVNGNIPETPGLAVDQESDEIRVDGRIVELHRASVYLALHKPKGYVSTASDDRQRPTVLNLVPKRFGRIYPVGRLDLDSEGLLLLTNDGALTHRLIHPRFHVPKTYHVWVHGSMSPRDISRLRRGTRLEDGRTARADVRVLHRTRQWTQLEFVLYEGRKRQIRRMCSAIGTHVTRLIRVQFGPIALGDLAPGTWRKLKEDEIEQLRRATLSNLLKAPQSAQNVDSP